MLPGSRIMLECSAPPVNLPQLPQLSQNYDLSVSSSTTETEKIRVGDDYSHVVFGQKFPG
jgi:hypothetical protein